MLRKKVADDGGTTDVGLEEEVTHTSTGTRTDSGTLCQVNQEADCVQRTRLVDRLDHRYINGLTVLGFCVPVVAYFWLVSRYSVNVIAGDQLDDVTVIVRSYSHLFDLNSLWALHNENRMLFPNLLVVLLGHTTGFNIQIEEYLSAIILMAATALLIWAHKRRSPSTPWIYYCPVVFLTFSVVQYWNTLFGFQIAWYIVLLALAGTMALVDRPALTWPTFIAAGAVGIIGSFSSLQGLIIWPVALILLYHRRRSRALIGTWIVLAFITAAVYFYNYNTRTSPGNHSYVWQHPAASLKYYLVALGDVLGFRAKFNAPGNGGVELFGLLILVLAVVTLIVYGLRRDERGAGPLGSALICFGLLFAAMVTAGRASTGIWTAAGSRFTTFDLLIPVGMYLVLVGESTQVRNSGPERLARQRIEDSDGGREHTSIRAGTGSGFRFKRAQAIIGIGVGFVIALQIGFGVPNGIAGARYYHAYQVQAARVVRNIDHESDWRLVLDVSVFGSPSFIRRQIQLAQKHHLSLFDGTSASG